MIIPTTLETLPEAARKLLDALAGDNKIIAFEAGMGVGKTTLISELARQLGSDDHTGSPTFAIVNQYTAGRKGYKGLTAPGDQIYHFDFYRLDAPSEALDIGVEDYFYSGDYCFVEWPEKIGNLLPEDAVFVKIEELSDGSRQIELNDR